MNESVTLPSTEYDRQRARLDGLPDMVHTQPSTIDVLSFYGVAETFIVQTFRQTQEGDTIFLQRVSAEGSMRIVIPAKIADVIARQRDALATLQRRKIGKRTAAARKAAGLAPAFMKNPGRRKRSKR